MAVLFTFFSVCRSLPQPNTPLAAPLGFQKGVSVSRQYSARRGSVVNVKSLYRQTGQMFSTPLRLGVLFCRSVYFVLFFKVGVSPVSSFLSLMTFSLAETFNLQS